MTRAQTIEPDDRLDEDAPESPGPKPAGNVTIINNYDQTAVKYVITPARQADNPYTRADGELP